MAYLTVSGVRAMYAEIDRLVTTGKRSTVQVAEWIARSENLINGKLAARYAVPFATTPPLVETMAWEFFEYFWQKDMHTPTATGDEVNWADVRFKRWLKMLDDIAAGKMPLVDESGNVISPSARLLGVLRSNHQECDQVFTMDEGWDQSVPSDYADEPEI